MIQLPIMRIPDAINLYHQLDFPEVVELPPEEGQRLWDLAIRLQQNEKPDCDY